MTRPIPGPEKILCAAVYVDTGEVHPPRSSYAYPETGLVFAGWRHGECFMLVEVWLDGLSQSDRPQYYRLTLGGEWWVEGFLTSTGRFVDREEAWRIARTAGQLRPDAEPEGSLLSENLY